MKISIHGLGYVGCVGVGCLSELGHEVIGVDIDPVKVGLVNSGKATIVEQSIDDLIKKNYDEGLIKATANSSEAVLNSDVGIICVGTPNDPNGHLDMSHIYTVAKEIGKAIAQRKNFYTLAIRSTVMPGTNKKIAEIIAGESGKKNGTDFAVVSNPEFLREGSAVNDFFNPPYTVLASKSSRGIDVMREVYGKIKAEVIVTDIGSAELIKFVNNSYHGLKVTFANEIGRICKALGVDSEVLMDLFVRDKILNISPYYFKPGFAYGGSCLPKDLKALNSIGHDKYLKLPVLSAIDASNQIHIEYALDAIIKKNKRKIGFYGISFKAGTDDLRFSPALELVERLLGKGYEVKIYDRNVHLYRLMGKNKDFIYNKLPHINEILYDELEPFLESAELIVVVNNGDNLGEVLRRTFNKIEIIDFIRVKDEILTSGRYEGICW